MNIFKKAFTLAEIMIVLTIIGVITGILLPIARQSLPDEKVMKFKKGHATLYKVINELVTSDKYYKDGDLGVKPDGTLVDSPTYFCNSFSDVVSTKKIECIDSASELNTSALLSIENSNPDMGWQNIDAAKYIDCMCKKYAPENPEIITSDKINFYSINPYVHFGTKDGEDRIFKASRNRFKYFCMDIDDLNKGVDPFGYAIRTDGKILLGERVKNWQDKNMNDENNSEETETINSCSIASIDLASRDDKSLINDVIASNSSGAISGGESGETPSGGDSSEEPAPSNPCVEGQYWDGSTCKNCVALCAECTDSTYSGCVRCKEGYYLNDIVCNSCAWACGTCTGPESEQCTSCITGTFKHPSYGFQSCLSCGGPLCAICDKDVGCTKCDERISRTTKIINGQCGVFLCNIANMTEIKTEVQALCEEKGGNYSKCTDATVNYKNECSDATSNVSCNYTISYCTCTNGVRIDMNRSVQGICKHHVYDYNALIDPTSL